MMKISTLIMCMVMIALAQLSCNKDDIPQSYRDVNTCEDVRIFYPNASTDSCEVILEIIDRFPPPDSLPNISSAQSNILGARVRAQDLDRLYVPQHVPNLDEKFWQAGPRCDAFSYGRTDLITTRYCPRPPVDRSRMSFSFKVAQDSLENPFRIYDAMFTYEPVPGTITRYRMSLTDSASQKSNLLAEDQMYSDNKILTGTFDLILRNIDNSSDVLMMENGRVRYYYYN